GRPVTPARVAAGAGSGTHDAVASVSECVSTGGVVEAGSESAVGASGSDEIGGTADGTGAMFGTACPDSGSGDVLAQLGASTGRSDVLIQPRSEAGSAGVVGQAGPVGVSGVPEAARGHRRPYRGRPGGRGE